MMDFINLLQEEWIYHLSNLGILIVFSFYGAYSTVKKNIRLEVFRLSEKQKKKVSEKQKEVIKRKEKKIFFKEFIKIFLVFFILYAVYILYRAGLLGV